MQDLRITLRGGYVIYFFDSGGTTNRTDDLSSYYFGLTVNHRLTDFITHGLSVDRSVQQGLNQGSDVTESLNLSYNVSWAFHRRASVSVSPFYEHGNEPQFGVEEKYDRFGFSLGLSYRFTNQLTSSLGYRYTERSTNFAGRDYQNNSVTFGANYQF
jgi:opacity protein-like surface antigen